MKKICVCMSVIIALFFIYIPCDNVKAEVVGYSNINEWLIAQGYDELPSYNEDSKYIAYKHRDLDYMYIYEIQTTNEVFVLHDYYFYVLNCDSLIKLGYYETLESGGDGTFYEDNVAWSVSEHAITYNGVEYLVNGRSLNEAPMGSSKELTCYYTDVNIYKGTFENVENMTLLIEKNPIAAELNPDANKLTEVSMTGCVYNGIPYEWSDEVKTIIAENGLEEYMVISNPRLYVKKDNMIYSTLSFYYNPLGNSFTMDAVIELELYNDPLFGAPDYIVNKTVNVAHGSWYMVQYYITEDGKLEFLNSMDGVNGQSIDFELNNFIPYAPSYQGKKSDYDYDGERVKYRKKILSENLVMSTVNIYALNGEIIYTADDVANINNDVIFEKPQIDFDEVKDYSITSVVTMVEDLIKGCIVVFEDAMETDKPPEIIMKVDDYYGASFSANVLDLTWYEPYREMVQDILTALFWGVTAFWAYKYIPKMLGVGGSE